MAGSTIWSGRYRQSRGYHGDQQNMYLHIVIIQLLTVFGCAGSNLKWKTSPVMWLPRRSTKHVLTHSNNPVIDSFWPVAGSTIWSGRNRQSCGYHGDQQNMYLHIVIIQLLTVFGCGGRFSKLKWKTSPVKWLPRRSTTSSSSWRSSHSGGSGKIFEVL